MNIVITASFGSLNFINSQLAQSRIKIPKHKSQTQNHQLAQLATDVFAPYSPDLNPIERIGLTMKAHGFNNYVCKSEEKLLERLDQALLDVIDNPEKTQQTTAIETLF